MPTFRRGAGAVTRLGQVEIYCSATNRFCISSYLGNCKNCKTIFASSWTQGPELLTARSDLACVRVPRGDIFWEDMDWQNIGKWPRRVQMWCAYILILIDLEFCLTKHVLWRQTYLYCLTPNTVLWTCMSCIVINCFLTVLRRPYLFCPE